MIPIDDAKQFGKDHNLKQVIIFGWDGEQTHVVTWGKSIKDCAQAAEGANKIKTNWGWPEEMIAEPARVTELKRKLENMMYLLKENEQLESENQYLQRELDRLTNVG